MGNRWYNNFFCSLEKEPVHLYADITFNGASAPTINRAKGITSISAPSAGVYTVTFQDVHNKLLNVSLDAVYGSALGTTPFLLGQVYINTDNTNAAAKTLLLMFPTDSAAAGGTIAVTSNPGGTPRALLRFVFSNSGAV